MRAREYTVEWPIGQPGNATGRGLARRAWAWECSAPRSTDTKARMTVATTEPKPRNPAVEHLTVAERAARGKAARAEVPRSSHGDWEPAADRPDPIELLKEQAATRVPELVPIRYGRMAVSPFTFYRGAAYVMASDLATTPRS